MITITKSSDLIDDYCNCCGSRESLDEDKFKMSLSYSRNDATNIRFCRKHLAELYNEIGEVLKINN